MPNCKAAYAVVIVLAFTGCTKPADVSRPLIEAGDKNAKIEVKDTANGFTVDLRYSRYQMIPQTDALIVACRSIVTTRAAEEAKLRGREIQPFDEQTVRVSTWRNIVNGRTSCRAFTDVLWKH